MSSDADIIGKLSRIFETHTFSRGENDWELDDLLEDLEYDQGYSGGRGGDDYGYSPSRSMGRSPSPPRGLNAGDLNGFASSGALNSPTRMMSVSPSVTCYPSFGNLINPYLSFFFLIAGLHPLSTSNVQSLQRCGRGRWPHSADISTLERLRSFLVNSGTD